MPKLPSVTIGKATGQTEASPSASRVSLGRATGTAQPRAPLRVQQLTIEQLTALAPQSTILTIEELTGQQRLIKLSGRCMPYRPGSMKFSSEHEISETRYMGYPRTSQTPTGAKENDTEMSGAWKDLFVGDLTDGPSAMVTEFTPEGVSVPIGEPLSRDQTMVTARQLCELFEDVVYRARPLRVRWQHIRRVGRLCKFEQDWQNPHDVIWKMTFKWIGRDEKVGFPSPVKTTLTGVATSLGHGYQGVQESTNFDGLESLEPRFADRVDFLVGDMQRALIDITDTAEARAAAVTDSRDAIRRALSISTLLRDQAASLVDTLAGTVPGDMVVSVPVGLDQNTEFSLTAVDPGLQITAACQQYIAIKAARAMRHAAARQRFSAMRDLDDDVLGVVVLRDQQDLRDLARFWYGSPAEWEQIRRFNGLAGSSAPAGTTIFIPSARTS